MAANSRILALAWNAPNLGFAVFDGPTHLLAYGSRGLHRTRERTNYSADLQPQIHRLIEKFSPAVVAVNGLMKQKRTELNVLGRSMRMEATRAGIEAALVKDAEIQEAFGKFTDVTRYNLAAWSALFFPALRQQFSDLVRKPQYLPAFDAVSVGIAYLARFGEYELKLSNISGSKSA